MEYSRHTQAHDDARAGSKSMVEKHAKAQKDAMQEACLGALRRAVPSASAETCLMALQATDWDADAAFHQLKSFMTTQPSGGGGGGGGGGGSGGGSKKDSKKSGKKDSTKKHKRRRSDSSDSDSDSDGSSDSESSSASSSSSSSSSQARKKSSKRHKKDDKKKKQKKDGKKKRSKDDSKKKKKKSSKKSSKKKSDDSHVKKQKLGPVESFGARGFLRETDKYDKEAEFRAWVEEVKKQSVESLQKWEEKELFKEYAEDYNTSTLTHEKYYNLELWAKKEAQQRLASDGGVVGGAEEERTAFDDETERKREIAAERDRRANEYKREAYVRMKQSGDLENLKEQERLKEMKQFAYNIGDMDTVAKVNKTLAPD